MQARVFREGDGDGDGEGDGDGDGQGDGQGEGEGEGEGDGQSEGDGDGDGDGEGEEGRGRAGEEGAQHVQQQQQQQQQQHPQPQPQTQPQTQPQQPQLHVRTRLLGAARASATAPSGLLPTPPAPPPPPPPPAPATPPPRAPSATPPAALSPTAAAAAAASAGAVEAPVAAPDLFPASFASFLESGAFSDAVVVFDGVRYRVHRLIVSRSSRRLAAAFAADASCTEVELPRADPGGALFPTVLRFLYGGAVVPTEDTAMPLMALGRLLEADALTALASEFLARHIRRTNALHMLGKAIEFGSDAIAERCLRLVAKHFWCQHDADYTFLPLAHMRLLVHHDELGVKDEYQLYRAVKAYVRRHRETLAAADVRDLFSAVRVALLPFRALRAVARNADFPQDLLLRAALWRLERHESSRTFQAAPADPWLRPRRACGVTLDLGDGGAGGVFAWIGTAGGRTPWVNSCTRGVCVTASSVSRGEPTDLVGSRDEHTELWTNDVPSSWFAVDLGETRRIVPTCYTLTHGGNYNADFLRTWHFQGSNDGETWTTLTSHHDDDALNSRFAEHSWLVAGVDTAYRHFRVLQHGRNASRRNFLLLSGIEIYGELFESE